LTVDKHTFIGLGVAALIGLVIGIERQWSGRASGPQARFAGVRTFFMLGLMVAWPACSFGRGGSPWGRSCWGRARR
jgi:uncharacterized membrane protein YhiD involved in acid resistance